MRSLAIGLAAAALAATAAQAQGWNGERDVPPAGWDYPEFRGPTAHIRSEIREGLNEGWLDDDQARDFGGELGRIQSREVSTYRAHGWRLPDGDRDEIHERIDRLAQAIDQARSEGDDRGWNGDHD
ncbi:MAG TPA: hypothetical protein VMT68_15235 [Caulobacteraceae bacterium]|nr:hypothetical protein [Caulobacteraceae bacterium]